MDNAFWQEIIRSQYAVPNTTSALALTPELLSMLGSPDGERREQVAFPILEQWIHKGRYTGTELWFLVEMLLSNLKVGLGEQGTETVYLRSFSALTLSEILHYDYYRHALTEAQVRQILEPAVKYLVEERDLRAYEHEHGWIHAVAHAGDLLWTLAHYGFFKSSDLARMMDAIAARVHAPVSTVFLMDEEERLVRGVMKILERDLLPMEIIDAWLADLVFPEERPLWNDVVENIEGPPPAKAEVCARHNTRNFLRSLYFQLVVPGFGGLTFVDSSPEQVDELMMHVVTTLQSILAWV